MARNKSKTLTEAELRIMDVVWQLETASVRAVLDGMKPHGALAYNTVQTMMNILTDKGYLVRKKDGRAFVYEPLVSRNAARAQALQHLTKQFFAGSKRELLHNLLESEADPAEIDELRAILKDAKRRSDEEAK